MSGIILPSDPPTCQVEIKDPSKAYEAVVGSVDSKFEALLNRLLREKVKVRAKDFDTIVNRRKD